MSGSPQSAGRDCRLRIAIWFCNSVYESLTLSATDTAGVQRYLFHGYRPRLATLLV